MPLHVSSTCAHHQEVKIALYSIWYHRTYRWPSRAQVERGPVHEAATYSCDTRGCVMQFWPPDDVHMCSKHVEAWNKLIVKKQICASSWLITEIKKKSSKCFGRPSDAIMHRRCCLLAASSVHYSTSCKHSLVLLGMGEIIARNMLGWLKLLINC